MTDASELRLGVDLGGTKIAGATLAPDGAVCATRRIANPGSYDRLLVSLRELADDLAPRDTPLGLATPGSVSPTTGLVRNSNTVWLTGRALARDVEAATGRPSRLANDADCFTLSEAVDGAAAGARLAFGVILGTGVGGGVAVDGALLPGAGGIAGEWGHVPLPWAESHEHPGPPCWCGRRGCMETWASGPALERDHGGGLRGPEIVMLARAGEPAARAALDRYVSRLGRGLAMICNIIDPEVIVLGGGLSAVHELYAELPAAMTPYVFSDKPVARVLPNRHGDASGYRGAAWLWPPAR